MNYLSYLESSFRLAAPLLFAALGGCLSERAGIAQLGLEGFLLLGAFLAAACSAQGLALFPTMLLTLFVGGVLGFVFAYFSQKYRANSIVLGTATVMVISGLCPLLSYHWFSSTGSTPPVPTSSQLSGYWVMSCFPLAFLLEWIRARTRFGLMLELAGEHPQMLWAQGVSLFRVRSVALVFMGMLTAMGGAVLSIGLSSQFTKHIAGGRGYIALAAVIVGRWSPLGAMIACLAFGFLESLQIRLQGVEWMPGQTVPVQWIQMLPYFVTLAAIAGFAGKSRPPRAIR